MADECRRLAWRSSNPGARLIEGFQIPQLAATSQSTTARQAVP
jgi:hypothetical protein